MSVKYCMHLADSTSVYFEYANGNNLATLNKEPIDTSIFSDENLVSGTFEDYENNTITEFANLSLIQQQKQLSGEYYICFRQKSDAELKQEQFENSIAELVDTQIKFENAISMLSTYAASTVQVMAVSMTDAQLLNFGDFVAEWNVGVAYEFGNVVKYNGELYRVVQAHTSQADWTPDVTASLYTHVVVDEETGIEEWIQPTGVHDAYALGAEVMHNGVKWRSIVDNNVWEPGVYGWEVAE